MISRPQLIEAAPSRRNGFSLIEMLLTVTILTVIMIGLVVMFNQVRKAFTGSFTQVDVLQSGRSAADLIGREMEQMAAVGATNITNFYVDSPSFQTTSPFFVVQANNSDQITNNLQELYFISRNNQQFTGIGYRLLTSANGLGTLVRFSTNAYTTNLGVLTNQILLFTSTNIGYGSNFVRLVDGVVNFRVRAFDASGVAYANVWLTNVTTGVASPHVPYVNASGTATVLSDTNIVPNEQLDCAMAGTALPAYVEIELGILEDRTLTQYQTLASSGGAGLGTAAYNYLVNHPAQVHVFRQRISIRNFDPAAFP